MGFLSGIGSLLGGSSGIGALLGGGIGMLSAKQSNKAQEQAYNQYLAANKDAGQKVWTEEQKPYVFGPGWQPEIPAVNPDAISYYTTIAAGGVPGIERAQAPMSWDNLVSQMPGENGGQFGSGLIDLLGYGSMGPPSYFAPTDDGIAGQAPQQASTPLTEEELQAIKMANFRRTRDQYPSQLGYLGDSLNMHYGFAPRGPDANRFNPGDQRDLFSS